MEVRGYSLRGGPARKSMSGVCYRGAPTDMPEQTGHVVESDCVPVYCAKNTRCTRESCQLTDLEPNEEFGCGCDTPDFGCR